MNESDPEFDDPAFRSAVRRTMGSGIAPPSLRWKVAAMLTEANAAGASSEAAHKTAVRQTVTRPARLMAGRSRWKTFAAAAVMLIAIGLVVVQIREEFFPPVFNSPAPVSPLASTVVELVHTHDQCAKLPDHHLVAGDDLASLGAKLSADEKIPVFAASLGSDWQFKGAGLCPVGSARAAHLIFVRADEFVSIFSLPSPSSCGNESSGDYRQTIEHHPVAGVYRGGALYCVIGSRTAGEMAPSEIEPILVKVSAAMATANPGNFRSAIATASISH